MKTIQGRVFGSAMAAMVAVAISLSAIGVRPVAASTTGGPPHGYVMVWGNLIDGLDAVPQAAFEGVVDVAAAGHLALALKWDGSVVAWGDDSHGQADVPAGLTNVKAIASGGTFAVALKKNGSVVVWGDNSYGQANVPAAAKSGVVAIAAGQNFVVALKSTGKVLAWGDDSHGATDIPFHLVQDGGHYVFVPIGNLSAVSAAGQVLGVMPDGTVAAWGDNSYLQTAVPSFVSNIATVAAGGTFSLALRTDGSLAAWGDNSHGQLNVPCSLSVWSPITQSLRCVEPVTGYSAVAAGNAHGLAIRNSELLVWGDNTYGQGSLPFPSDWTEFNAIAAGADWNMAVQGNVGAPDMPEMVSAIAGNQSALVSWQWVDDGGAPITKIVVTASPGGQTCTTTAANDGLAGSCLVTGLVNYTSYTFKVAATNGIGTGLPSVPTAAVTPHP